MLSGMFPGKVGSTAPLSVDEVIDEVILVVRP